MFVDKMTVIRMLNKASVTYDSDLIAINLLPDDATFYINVEDVVAAEYYDEELEEMHVFELDCSYISTSRVVSGDNLQDLEDEMSSSIGKEISMKRSNKGNKAVTSIVVGLGITVVLFLVVAVVGMVVGMFS